MGCKIACHPVQGATSFSRSPILSHIDAYIPGQRWVSDTESDLGLGMIAEVDSRTVSVLFLASGEHRTYSKTNAPLSRVRLSPGEDAQSREEWKMTIEVVHEQEGLLIYEGVRQDTNVRTHLPESQLNSFLQITDAQSRLLNGQIDTHKWFELRLHTHQALDTVQKSDTYGLQGARVSLIPHQLFIANEVANRFAPRVLLADEVGLGKTIEACLILNKQLLTGRAQRILIVVPEPLLHQWLVELMRRFNLRFSLFDEERCTAIQESDSELNPFETEQLILASYSLFSDEKRQQEATSVRWDILVVDEAHHLEWSKDHPSDRYIFIEALTKQIPGVLLLTATPEQLGEESHFARLRLLDADRFTDFDSFMEEQRRYRRISEVVDELASETALSNQALSMLRHFTDQDSKLDTQTERQDTVRNLIDRHGPSRVLFRNTRSNIPGFPERRIHSYPLTLPDEYAEEKLTDTTIEHLLFPELNRPRIWTKFDPRIEFIRGQLNSPREEKILIICSRAQTVVDLESTLRNEYGIHVAVFHEEMSMVARDRGAHFFADPNGSRLLICSEIGSEGRNFQFAHHLLLFDLPFNPDLLEQRIGRLDRIGQTQDIRIHILYFSHSAQEVLFRWYHEGMNAFETTCPVGQSVFEDMQEDLTKALRNWQPLQTDELVQSTRAIYNRKLEVLEKGRDRLLEISSFDAEKADTLVSSIQQTQKNTLIQDYLEKVFDAYGVDFEDKDANSYIVRPSEHMRTPYFPHLGEHGTTVTFLRESALAHEDIEYLSWEHPMSRGAMDLVLTSDHGKASIIGVEFDLVPKGTLLVETCYILELIAPNAPELRRFLDRTVVHFLVDESGRDLSNLLTSGRLFNQIQDIDKTMTQQLLLIKRDGIVSTVEKCANKAKAVFDDVITKGRDNLEAKIRAEHQRLMYLKSLRASVREEEIQMLRQQRDNTLQLFSNAQTRLDAVRLIITL